MKNLSLLDKEYSDSTIYHFGLSNEIFFESIKFLLKKIEKKELSELITDQMLFLLPDSVGLFDKLDSKKNYYLLGCFKSLFHD